MVNAGFNANALAHLDASIQKDIDEGTNLGASIVVARGGEIGHEKFFGTVAENRTAAPDDLYLLMSLSKSFTAALVLRAIDEGRFTLDTRIADLVPGFGVHGKQNVTIRMLLTHTGGTYPGLAPLPGMTLPDLGNLAKCTAAFAGQPAAFTPGTRCHYNSFGGISVLGQILVLTDPSGRSFSHIAQEDLFEPLGMADTRFGIDFANPRRVPTSFGARYKNPTNEPTIALLSIPFGEGCEVPAGNAFGTTMDVFRFAEALRMGGKRDGYRLISPTLLDYAARVHTGDMINGAIEFDCAAKGLPPARANFSLLGGYARGEGHFLTGMGFTASPRAFCAIGGGSTMWMVDPDRDLTFVFLSAGLVEGIAHIERLSRLADLALAACD
jgi:CubicO group peptidase (beta-lactamase class C family)